MAIASRNIVGDHHDLNDNVKNLTGEITPCQLSGIHVDPIVLTLIVHSVKEEELGAAVITFRRVSLLHLMPNQ